MKGFVNANFFDQFLWMSLQKKVLTDLLKYAKTFLIGILIYDCNSTLHIEFSEQYNWELLNGMSSGLRYIHIYIYT